MDIESNGSRIFVRVDQDEDVVATVRSAVERLDLSAAVVTSGIGLVRSAELGSAAGRRSFAGPLDLSALSGSVLRRHGTQVARLQVVLNDARNRTIGGRLLSAKCHGVVGVLLAAVDLSMDVST
ncbi:DNA-binding protein [Actinoplanes sp. Pm04-4]|jgi:predicted DNA-binding protein with PD1-like motif|uniref:DNA-binding protein n=1 Tax=Paractinoplanes pyxinae TaxID=2997416 RepID=A0ABT4AY93_9ACTN|nr:PPC domain-containing DNA-binding protein [Actinoplanes pyxinae]MCY1139201.1 DNA-binding protein [Actinoplanes pyxinae]